MAKYFTDRDLLVLDFFVAGVPPGPLYKMSFNDLKTMIKNSKMDETNTNLTPEICLIALVSYTEAFFKNQFAAIVNICPQLLERFCSRRPDSSVTIKDLISIDLDTKNRLGFILAEKYDFGSPKAINSLYFDLLSISVFSKDELLLYNRLLNDRNLLVHHGGIYTMRYNQQNYKKQKIGNRIFFDSLVISKASYQRWATFVNKIVGKTISVCHKATVEYLKDKKIRLVKERRRAFEFLDWYE